ncbi:MAG: Bax inhibitor-1/YccA family protein [Spirochaetales bacterium]|nr:Bax inhibitor-1/YccA family protein [Spirochaetales bacterium]
MARTLAAEKSSGTGFLFNPNPIIRRLSRVQDTDSENCCTYSGIQAKLVYFMIMVFIGVALNLIMAGRWGGQIINLQEQGIVLTSHEAIAVVVAALALIVSPILATFIRITIPVTGALFCASTGFVIAWAATAFGKEYAQTIWLALLITAIVVMVMGFLYWTGKVQVTKKFRTVLIVLVITSVFASLLTFILSLIPATKGFVAALGENSVFNIAVSAIMVVIASLFLLVDFDEIKRSVDEELPKKYEWSASFGLAFGIIWLFFKILELLGKAKGNKSN